MFLTVTPCKDYTESLTLWRRIFLIGCIQHDMIAVCEPVIILYGLIPVTFAALSLSFSKVFWVQTLFSPHAFPEALGAESYLPRRPSTVFAHGLHIYFSEFVSCSLEISTGRDLRVGRASTPFLSRTVYIFISLSLSVVLLKFPLVSISCGSPVPRLFRSSRLPFTDRGRTL